MFYYIYIHIYMFDQAYSCLLYTSIDHYLKEEELTAEFGENGWKQLPDAISRCYQFIPASVVIEEHHILSLIHI